MQCRRLIVAPDLKAGNAFVKALDLDTDIWLVRSWGSTVAGHRFERIVVLDPRTRLTSRDEEWMNDIVNRRLLEKTADGGYTSPSDPRRLVHFLF